MRTRIFSSATAILATLAWLWASLLTAQESKPKPFDALHFEVIGSPTVLNNRTSPNTIVIGVTNFSLQADQPDVVLPINSTISIRIVAEPNQSSTNQYKRSWALATTNQINAGKIRMLRPDGTDATADWTVNIYPGAGQTDANGLCGWTMTTKQTVSLLQNQSYYIEVSNLITNAPSGATLVYYEVAGPNGSTPSRNRFGPLNKSMEVERNSKIGINTTDPQAPLDVNGRIIGRDNLNLTGEIKLGSEDFQTRIGNKLWPPTGVGLDIIAPGDVKSRRITLHAQGEAKILGPLKVEQGNITTTGRFTDKTGDVMPVGSIIAYGGNTAPPGWLLCDGKLMYNIQSYNDLYKALGSPTPIIKDNVSYFKVPDLSNRFIVGAGGEYSVGSTGGAKEVTLTEAQMPSHRHSGTTNTDGAHSHTSQPTARADNDDDDGTGLYVGTREDRNKTTHGTRDISNSGSAHSHSFTTGNTGGSQAHENRPPYYALTYIIKY